MQPEKINFGLEGLIRARYDCDATHVASEPVHEVFQGQTAWQGTVEVFELIGCLKAKRAYAWQYEDDDKATKTVVVLEIPPVDSPQTAVKVAIAAKAKEK